MKSRQTNILGCLLLTASGLCLAEPAFFIDTPKLLRRAAEETYAKHPDIPKSGLVVAPDPLQFSCAPEQKRYLHEEAATQCLKYPYAPSPCTAEVRLVIRASVEQHAVALKNGQCRFEMKYRGITVEFFQDGAIEIRRPDFDFEAARTEDCSIDQSPREIDAVIAVHESLLSQEYAIEDGE